MRIWSPERHTDSGHFLQSLDVELDRLAQSPGSPVHQVRVEGIRRVLKAPIWGGLLADWGVSEQDSSQSDIDADDEPAVEIKPSWDNYVEQQLFRN